MKARKLILTAGVVVALAGPATAGATVQIDGGGGSAKAVKSHVVKVHRHDAKSSATAIRLGAYNSLAYVPGGSSRAAALAITRLGKLTAKPSSPRPIVEPSRPLNPGGTIIPSSSRSGAGLIEDSPDACLMYSVCTNEELCSVWGMNCLLLEHPWDPLESTCRHASLSIL